MSAQETAGYKKDRESFRLNRGPCLPMMSPVDVQLDRDNRTMVQPDVIIVCDRSKITYKGIFGAPAFYPAGDRAGLELYEGGENKCRYLPHLWCRTRR